LWYKLNKQGRPKYTIHNKAKYTIMFKDRQTHKKKTNANSGT